VRLANRILASERNGIDLRYPLGDAPVKSKTPLETYICKRSFDCHIRNGTPKRGATNVENRTTSDPLTAIEPQG